MITRLVIGPWDPHTAGKYRKESVLVVDLAKTTKEDVYTIASTAASMSEDLVVVSVVSTDQLCWITEMLEELKYEVVRETEPCRTCNYPLFDDRRFAEAMDKIGGLTCQKW